MTARLLDVPEAATHLGVTQDWLRREASAGRIRSRKIGRRRCFTEQDLDDYIEASVYRAADPLTQTSASRTRRRRSP